MQIITTNDRTLIKARQAIENLSISVNQFFTLANNDNCILFVDIPDATIVCMVSYGSYSDVFIANENELNRIRESRHPIAVDEDIEFLCLSSSEAQKLAYKDEIKKKHFEAVGRMCSDGIVVIFDIDNYKSTFQDTLSDLSTYSEFVTFQTPQLKNSIKNPRSESTTQTSVSITLDSLLIRASDLIGFSSKLQNHERNLGKFKSTIWTSPMLLELNEASTYFLSEPGNLDIKMVRDWFQKRWSKGGVGKDVIEQAANAVIPDQLYKDSPNRCTLSDQTIEKYNSYASTALIIINEFARECWERTDSHAPKHHFPKRNTIIDELKGKGLTTKLAGAASSIIRPK